MQAREIGASRQAPEVKATSGLFGHYYGSGKGPTAYTTYLAEPKSLSIPKGTGLTDPQTGMLEY